MHMEKHAQVCLVALISSELQLNTLISNFTLLLRTPTNLILQCELCLVSYHGHVQTNSGTLPYGECVRATETALHRVVSDIHYLVTGGITIKWHATHLIEEANAVTSNKAQPVQEETPLEVHAGFETKRQNTHSVF